MKKRDSRNCIYISSGKFKGRKIFLPDVETTRPSKSIVRDSIFNTIQSELYSSTFIEMFAGSGSIGFEALSRGAEKVYFLERNRVAIRTLNENRSSFSGESIDIVSGDSFQNLKPILKNSPDNTILYIDPPFNIRDGMEDIYSRIYSLVEQIESGVELIIFEHISSEKLEDKIGRFHNYKQKRFGKSTISYFRLDLLE